MRRDLQVISENLARRLPDGRMITGVRQLSDGFSNATYLVEGLDLILRMPPLGNPLLAPNRVHDVVGQYEIMMEWSSRPTAPPVPKMVHVERDPTVLGDPFFLMERVDFDPWGDWGLPDWVSGADVRFRSQISEQFVDTYSRLHRLEPLAALGRPLSNLEELDRWAEPVRLLDVPALNTAFAILFESVPPDAAPAPCHCDAKPANLLWKGGRIVAVIDHEMSFNGDPRSDLATLLQSFETLGRAAAMAGEPSDFWDRERIVTEWQARTGRGAEHVIWFEAASKARYASILAYGDHLFTSGESSDDRYGMFGPVLDQLSQSALDLARRYHAELSTRLTE